MTRRWLGILVTVVWLLAGCAGSEPTPERVNMRVGYGDAPQAFGTLTIPARPGPIPIVVLIHGGFWRQQFGPDLMQPLADDLERRGAAVWNIDYRAVGDPDGGWPGTFLDVATAMDALAENDEITTAAQGRLDLDNVVVVGHSAGGHLALWTASRDALRTGDPGAEPVLLPSIVVAQAPVVDLAGAAGRRLGADAVQGLMGGEPEEVPDRYRVGQPRPAEASIVLVHGLADDIVPFSEASMLLGEAADSIWFGFDRTALVDDPSAGHFSVIDPEHPMWTATLELVGL